MATAPSFDGTQPCANLDSEIFFPELVTEYDENDKPLKPTKQEEFIYQQKVEKAKAICNTCLFVVECLEYALKTSAYGIWGATNEQERRRIKKQKYREKQKSAP
jgi:hypothetical protein